MSWQSSQHTVIRGAIVYLGPGSWDPLDLLSSIQKKNEVKYFFMPGFSLPRKADISLSHMRTMNRLEHAR